MHFEGAPLQTMQAATDTPEAHASHPIDAIADKGRLSVLQATCLSQ
jgi:hypothetical protein